MAQAGAAQAAQGEANHVVRGAICALLGGASWGFSGTCAQLLLDSYGIPALWVTCVRLAIAAVVFMILAVIADGRTLRACLRDVRALGQIALFAVFGVVFTQMSYLLAITNTNAGTATVIQQIGLVIIMVITCVRFRRGPKAREVAGLLFALAGVFVIATQGDPLSLSISPTGLFWGIMCGIGLACYTLLPEQVLKKWGSLPVTGLAMLFGGIASAAVVRPWTYDIQLSLGAVAALAALVLIGTFLAYLLYLQGIKDAGPVRASLLCCIEPVSAMAISAVWLGTAVSMWDVIGCILILIMIFLVTGSPKQDSASSQVAPAGDASASEAVQGVAKTLASGGSLSNALPQDDPLFHGRASVLGYYSERPASHDDFDKARALLKRTHEALVSAGMGDEGKQYPSSRRLMRNIDKGLFHVVEDARGRLIAVFAVTFDPDKNYARGIEGDWLDGSDEGSYATLRWACVEPDVRRRGVGTFVLDKAMGAARSAGRRSVRVDIHPKNAAARAVLTGYGFIRCGTIEVRDALGRRKTREVYERLA